MVNAFHYDSNPMIGLYITPLREKVSRRNIGIPINNNLESLIYFQLWIREKLNPKKEQKALFLKSDGTCYTAAHWQLKTVKMIQLFNPSIRVTASRTLRRGLFTTNNFEDPNLKQLIADLYNVRGNCSKLWYDRGTTGLVDGRKVHETLTHAHIEQNKHVNDQLKVLTDKVKRIGTGAINQHTIRKPQIVNSRLMVVFEENNQLFMAKYKDCRVAITTGDLLIHKYNTDDKSFVIIDEPIILP